MIQRINLIEKQAFAFTYEALMRICLAIVAVNALLIGFQFLKASRIKPKIEAANIRVEQLTAENAELTKQPVLKKKKVVKIGEYQYLFDMLESIPNWSDVLRIVSNNLPNSVWVTNFKSLGAAVIQQPKKKDGKDDKDKKDDPKNAPMPTNVPIRVELTGVGMDIRSIAEFTSNLEKTPNFLKMTMNNTVKEKERYLFTIQGQVSPLAEDAR